MHYRDGEGQPRSVVPDFAYRTERSLWCIEVEGTDESSHILAKHARYAALQSALAQTLGPGFRLYLTIVFTDAELRRRVLRRHEQAFARQPWGYQLSWVDLDAALAADPQVVLDAVCCEIDWFAVREREKAVAYRLVDRYSR